MDEQAQPFRHSGKSAPQALIFLLIASLVAGAVLGFVYGYAIRYIPFIYINALVTAGYGFVAAMVAMFSLKAGRCRNVLLAGLFGLLGGTIMWYLGWVGYSHAVTEGEAIFWTPGDMWHFWTFLFEHNDWGFGSTAVSGWFLVVIWLIEAGIIIGMPALIAAGLIADTPYCETHACWLDDEEKIDSMRAIDDRAAIAKVRDGDLAPLAELKPRTTEAQRWCRMTLKSAAGCDCTFTLRLSTVRLEADKDGKLEEKVDDLTGDLLIGKDMYGLLKGFAQVKPVSRKRAKTESPGDTHPADVTPQQSVPAEEALPGQA